jgi:hypothetical protein
MAPAVNQNDIEDAEYSAAFSEDQSGPKQMSEDEAFSNMSNMSDESGTSEPEGDGAVVTIEGDGEPEGEVVAEAPAEMADADPASDEPTDPKDIQRQKSWEGRLKAREEELRMREQALTATASKPEQAATEEPAEAMEDAGEAVVEMAAAVSSGEMTAEQAMKTLEEDFGPEFVKMLDVLVSAKAGSAVDSKVGEVSKTVDQLIGELVDDKARTHFEAIADAHPDFAEINGSEALSAYMASLSDAERAKAEQVQAGGNARSIVKLLDGFKGWAEKQGGAKPQAAADDGMGMDMEMDTSGIDESAADAAEGVRSTGMSLPGAPDKDDSYESAWNKF